MLTETEAIERVARGASMLDRVAPGWERSVDVSELCMADGTFQDNEGVRKGGCLLCHVTQVSYLRGLVDFNLIAPERYGFYIHPRINEHWDQVLKGYALLEKIWITLIKERFSMGTLSG